MNWFFIHPVCYTLIKNHLIVLELNKQNYQQQNDLKTNTKNKKSNLISENQIELKGFPKFFNKFQVASLFSDFRPLSVQILADSTALVEFENKFQTVQVVLNYDQRIIENFVLLAKAKSEPLQLMAKKIAKRRLHLPPQIDHLIATIDHIKQESF